MPRLQEGWQQQLSSDGILTTCLCWLGRGRATSAGATAQAFIHPRLRLGVSGRRLDRAFLHRRSWQAQARPGAGRGQSPGDSAGRTKPCHRQRQPKASGPQRQWRVAFPAVTDCWACPSPSPAAPVMSRMASKFRFRKVLSRQGWQKHLTSMLRFPRHIGGFLQHGIGRASSAAVGVGWSTRKHIPRGVDSGLEQSNRERKLQTARHMVQSFTEWTGWRAARHGSMRSARRGFPVPDFGMVGSWAGFGQGTRAGFQPASRPHTHLPLPHMMVCRP